jgi:hypothetical protein
MVGSAPPRITQLFAQPDELHRECALFVFVGIFSQHLEQLPGFKASVFGKT